MQQAKADYAIFSQFDQAFHRVIMRASGSEVGRAIVSTIHEFGGQRPLLSPNQPVGVALLDRTVLEHRGVLEALVLRDSDLAASRIAAHIDSAFADRLQVNGAEPPQDAR
jgi:DNA-binding GntR family transcriptional regulator